MEEIMKKEEFSIEDSSLEQREKNFDDFCRRFWSVSDHVHIKEV